MDYKYWRCLSSPSSGPKLPEMLELPKSLQSNPRFITRKSLKESNLKEDKGEKFLQSNNVVVGIAGDVEPSARIDEGWIPALKNICGVGEPASQSMESVSCRNPRICLI